LPSGAFLDNLSAFDFLIINLGDEEVETDLGEVDVSVDISEVAFSADAEEANKQ